MARWTQLRELVQMLREETGRSTNPAVGNDDTPALKRMLRRWQSMLYEQNDWSFRTVEPTLQLNAGQRFYDMPDTLDFDRVESVAVWWGGRPVRITRGIGFREYAMFNSEIDERSDPVLRWDVKVPGIFEPSDTNGQLAEREMVEVWPIPSSSESRLQFRGVRKLPELVDDDDKAMLDDNLIVLFAAAQLLARGGAKDADAVASAAQTHLHNLLANTKADQPTVALGRGCSHSGSRFADRAVVIISGAKTD